jgi:hypothetical protein
MWDTIRVEGNGARHNQLKDKHMTDTNTQLVALTAEQTKAIHEVGFQSGRAGKAVDEATSAALTVVIANGGIGQTVVRDTFQVGFMAGYMAKKGALKPTAALIEEALIMRFAAGSGASKVKEGAPQRSPAWEQAYSAARKVWERILSAANVSSTESKGGARERSTSKTETSETDDTRTDEPTTPDVNVAKPKTPTVPKVADRKAANDWIAKECAVFVAFVVANPDHVARAVAEEIELSRNRILALLKD